ncbi:MAG: 50S ribosomal protein L21 [Candidatus Kerfeldbacteria bacterium]|nr:50S ribosomal protein L21 [Candidatus Kerfeldbacteria bacterium]
MVAVIEFGGKQYLVAAGQKVTLEKIPDVAAGGTVTFDRVLLTADKGKAKIGQPTVTGATVTGKVLKQFRGDKVTVLKYKPKVRYRKKYGHRQSLTQVEITKIS